MKIITIFLLICALLVMPQFQANVEADDEDMYACVKHNNGQFRLVDDPGDCNPSEYYIEYEINDDDELEVDICFTNDADCILKLNLDSDDSLFSVVGIETCPVDDSSVERNVYGSGFTNADGLQIGLTFTGNGSHDGAVFLLDLVGLCDVSGESCEGDGYAYLADNCDEAD